MYVKKQDTNTNEASINENDNEQILKKKIS